MSMWGPPSGGPGEVRLKPDATAARLVGRNVGLLDEPKLGRFRERVPEAFVAKVRADFLQADVRAVKGLASLLRPADVLQ